MVAIVASAVLPRPLILPFPANSHQSVSGHEEAEKNARAALAEHVRYKGGESLAAVYTGTPYTYASDLHIEHDGGNLTVHDIDWLGKPFNNPIYYGVRVIRWLPHSRWGAMVDFTHSKAYAPLDQKAEMSGTVDGRPLPAQDTIENVFDKLEFTHGHNMLTLNAMMRLPSLGASLSPYVGAGLGVALPHTEVQLKGTRRRTYEYQYAGPAGQIVIGMELRVPRLSYFLEYKFTSASYRVPLENRDGDTLPQDLWRQLQRWLSGRAPEGGWASTWLTSHQLIGGMGIRTVPH